MAIDSSIPLSGMNALSTLPTPTQTLNATIATQTALQQYQANKLSLAQTQRAQQSQQAISQAYQQNIDPNTGLIDSVGLANTIRNNPNITVGADDAIAHATDLHIAQLKMSQNQMTAAQQAATIQANSANAVLAAADKAGRPISQEDVINEAANAFNGGAWGDPKTSAAQAGMSKWISSAPTDPVQLDAWMRQQAANGNDAAAGLTRAITGAAGTVSLPQGALPTVTNLNTGQTSASGPIMSAGLAPAQALEQKTTKNPITGQDQTQTAGSQLVGQGVPVSAITGATGPGGGAPPAPAPVFGGGNGSYPSPFAGPGAPAAPAAPPQAAPASPYGGAVPTAPDPIPFGAKGTAAAAGTAQYVQDLHNASGYQTNISAGQHVLDLLTKMKASGTVVGGSSAGLNGLRTAVTSWLGGDPPGAAGATTTAQYQSELGKYLAQQTTQQPGAGQSADALAQALAGTPNTHMGEGAIEDTTRTLLAMQKMAQAKVLGYRNSPEAQGAPNGENYQQYSARFATTQDPRGYVADNMTPAQKQQMYAGMSDAEKTRFLASLSNAKATGVYNPTGAGQ